MEALRARAARKSLLFAAAAGAHVVVIALLIAETRTLHLPAANSVAITTLLLLPARRRPARSELPPPPALATPIAPITAPITLSLPAVRAPLPVPRPINWVRAARIAVSAILHRTRRHAFGYPKGARARTSLHSRPTGIRSQGRESYATRAGARVYRTGGNCALVSGPPPLDATWVERQAQMARVVCSGAQRGPSPDNLFKHLPAYRRYHTLPPLAVHPRPRAPRRGKRPASPRR